MVLVSIRTRTKCLSLENVSNLKDVLKVLVFVLKIERMFDLKMSKQLGIIYLLKSLSCLFPLSFDIVILPLIW